MTPRELKNSILQLAIQGRLVEQRPEEGTAAELYDQIQREKQALIKAGKLKKEKPLPEITEDEKPFDIPENWMWVRIAAVATLNPKNEFADDVEAGFIPMPCVSDGYRNEHTFETRKWGEIKKGFTHFADGDIGVAKITPCFQNRKSVIFKNLPNGFGAGTTELSIVRIPTALLLREYLLWFFKSEHFITNGKKSFTGTAGQQRIHKDYLSLCALPLPPLAEQKRIVARIEELLPLVDRYEQAWNRLEALNKRFPGDLQKSLLQLAIQGKLVEQRPEEGTGEELYQQIQREKQTLIKAGKLKKEKPLPEITEDEKPFDIPDSWKWVRFGELGSYKKGPFGSALTKSMFIPKGPNAVKVYEQKNAIQKDASLGEYYISREYFESKMSGFEVHPGDIIVSCAGTIGETYILPDSIEKGIINQALMRMQIFAPLFIPYFLTFFDFVLKENARTGSKGSAIKNIPPFEVLKNYLVPIPPLAEQKRINDTLETLLSVCNNQSSGKSTKATFFDRKLFT